MAGFYLCRNDARAEARLAAARAQFSRHGFTAPAEIATDTHRGFHAGYINGGPATFARAGDDFIAAAGTPVYRGELGEAALLRLLADFRLPFDDWENLAGHFALLVHKGGRTALLTGFFGAFQVFHDAAFDVVSTSFLSTLASLDRLRFDPQGVYEFAFNVFPTGDDTVVQEVKRLGPDVQIELGREIVRHPVAKKLPAEVDHGPLDARIAEAAQRLRTLAEPFARAYGDKVQCPLSGGLDSRLALAVLRDAGIRPHVYVYGTPESDDVQIAKAVGAAEGFAVEHFEKPKWRAMTPDDFAEQVERNFHECDALVTDGGLFDNGGNAEARHARQRGGQLAVSGGCGEVFRNFFYLPDRPMRVRHAVGSFYLRYAPSDVTSAFDRTAFLDRLEAKALEALELPPDATGLVPRPLIEQLYPRMRCRAFFGREISLVARFGGYFLPFFERPVAELALTLPMAAKNLGRFEAKLLNAVDPSLARHPSAYGYSFDQPPKFDHWFDEWSTRWRPGWMRRRSYALRRRLGPITDDAGGLLTPVFLGRVLDLHFPHMRRFFNPREINDTGLYRRIATLEYLAQHIEDRLAD